MLILLCCNSSNTILSFPQVFDLVLGYVFETDGLIDNQHRTHGIIIEPIIIFVDN